MKRHEKILVPLAGDETDKNIILWASMIARLSASKEVHFVNFNHKFVWESKNRGENWMESALEFEIESELLESVEKYWRGPKATEVIFHVESGKDMLHYFLEKTANLEADLVILGKEVLGASLAIRMIRKSTCSILMLPEDSEPKISSLMIPTDFSLHSNYAVEIAAAFAKSLKIPEINSYHSYNLGNKMFKSTTAESLLIDLCKEHAESEHEHFYSDFEETGVTIKTHNEFNNHTALAINEYAENSKADLVILSCRGSNSDSAWFLGSVSENLLRHATRPVLAVKHKGTGAEMLEKYLRGDSAETEIETKTIKTAEAATVEALRA